MRTNGLLFASCTVVFASCTADAPVAGRDGQRDAVAERTLEEALRLGGADAPVEVSFQTEPAVIVHSSGSVFVLHGQQGRVAMLDPSGNLIRWFGGRGSGPGEFDMVVAFGFLGDTLWLRNFPTPRITKFLLDGTHIETVPTPFSFGLPLTAPASISGYLADDHAWAAPEGFPLGMDTAVTMPVLLGSRSMTEPDTLFMFSNPKNQLAGIRFAPFARPPFHAIASNGTTIGIADWVEHDPSRVTLRVVNADGTTKFTRTMHFDAETVSSEVRDSVIGVGIGLVEEMASRLRDQGIPRGSYRETITASEVEARAFIPTHFPPIRQVLIGVDKTIWIERAEQFAGGKWLVLDSLGNELFSVRVPEGNSVRAVSQEFAWSTLRDSLDVPYLVRWNIRSEDR